MWTLIVFRCRKLLGSCCFCWTVRFTLEWKFDGFFSAEFGPWTTSDCGTRSPAIPAKSCPPSSWVTITRSWAPATIAPSRSGTWGPSLASTPSSPAPAATTSSARNQTSFPDILWVHCPTFYRCCFESNPSDQHLNGNLIDQSQHFFTLITTAAWFWWNLVGLCFLLHDSWETFSNKSHAF